MALRAGKRQKAKGKRQKAKGKRQKAKGKRQKAKGKSSTIKGFQLLEKFGGTETDTATAVALLGETPRPHCLNFSLLPMSNTVSA
ncbi:hypothetical protein VB834_22645 [Limnoraphis robusta Tam1]|uniref:hypothetical protein n=1 Tax=Limnoraphis robusta TaxID=1118279 RepID=UPI002B213A79|nr:hypothetical protein [Limnoraphis robusta]MEA5541834.1 hypothetical protein [Limnoraphis robusta Tam1]